MAEEGPKSTGERQSQCLPVLPGNGLERANSLFSPVLAMYIWWDKLEFHVPLEGVGSCIKVRKDNISSLVAEYPDGGFMI